MENSYFTLNKKQKSGVNSTNMIRYTNKIVYQLFLIFLILSISTVSIAAVKIKLTVKETIGINRNNEMVHNGVPISRNDKILTTSNLIINDGKGVQIPATFEVLSRWAGGKDDITKPIQWLLVSFPATLEAHSSATYYIQTGSPKVSTPHISIVETSSSIIVTTGPAKFVINKMQLNLFESLSVVNESETFLLQNNGGSYSTITGQLQATAETPSAITIERNNDHYACIKLEGKYSNNPVGNYDAEPLYYKIRYEFFAGSPTAIIYHKFYWPGRDNQRPYDSSITVDNVSLVLPDFIGLNSTEVFADAQTKYTGVLSENQTAKIEQKIRNVFSNPHIAEITHGVQAQNTIFASNPMLINRGNNGAVAVSIDHMKYFEPQSIVTDHQGKTTINVLSADQDFADCQGTWARVAVSALPSNISYIEALANNYAPLNNRLFAFPDSSYTANSKVFLELPTQPSLSKNDTIYTYYKRLDEIMSYTEEWLANEKWHGLMTWGSTTRYPEETGTSTGWDKIYAGANLTDYHNTWNNSVFLSFYQQNQDLLYDYSFMAARRVLHTQIIQPDDTVSSEFMGWGYSGYKSFRSDANSSHSYFENLYNYYYLTGDMEVIDIIKVAAKTKASWYTRNSDWTLNDMDGVGIGWVGFTGRVDFQASTMFNFIGHSYDPNYLDDFIHMYHHAFSLSLAILTTNNKEYGFVSSGENVTSGFTTEQFWMLSLYFNQGLSTIYNEWGDLSLGSSNVKISKAYPAIARTLKDYVSTISGNGTWGGFWINCANINYTGSKIGGTIISINPLTCGSDHLYTTGKANVITTILRGGNISNDNSLLEFGKEGLEWLVTDWKFHDELPFGKEIGIMWSRLHHGMSYLEVLPELKTMSNEVNK